MDCVDVVCSLISSRGENVQVLLRHLCYTSTLSYAQVKRGWNWEARICIKFPQLLLYVQVKRRGKLIRVEKWQFVWTFSQLLPGYMRASIFDRYMFQEPSQTSLNTKKMDDFWYLYTDYSNKTPCDGDYNYYKDFKFILTFQVSYLPQIIRVHVNVSVYNLTAFEKFNAFFHLVLL